jgi:hypothetical protein
MKYVIGFLGILVLFFVVTTLITGIFIGTGALISYLFNLSLFHSALLCISSAFTLSFFVYTMNGLINKRTSDDESDELEDLLDDMENLFYRHQPPKVVFDLPKKQKNNKK